MVIVVAKVDIFKVIENLVNLEIYIRYKQI